MSEFIINVLRTIRDFVQSIIAFCGTYLPADKIDAIALKFFGIDDFVDSFSEINRYTLLTIILFLLARKVLIPFFKKYVFPVIKGKLKAFKLFEKLDESIWKFNKNKFNVENPDDKKEKKEISNMSKAVNRVTDKRLNKIVSNTERNKNKISYIVVLLEKLVRNQEKIINDNKQLKRDNRKILRELDEIKRNNNNHH